MPFYNQRSSLEKKMSLDNGATRPFISIFYAYASSIHVYFWAAFFPDSTLLLPVSFSAPYPSSLIATIVHKKEDANSFPVTLFLITHRKEFQVREGINFRHSDIN